MKSTSASPKSASPKGASAKHVPGPKHNTVAGRARQHARQQKRIKARHAAAAKVTATAKPAAQAKARSWSPDGDVALCSARAFAQSLRIASGRAVADAAVLDLYWATAADADAGASILATAEAALAGRLRLRPVACIELFGELDEHCRRLAGFAGAEVAAAGVIPAAGVQATEVNWYAGFYGHPLIIGLDLPYGEPHTVCVGPDGTWWSWGRPFDPADWPGLVIEEAWAVTW